MVTLGRVIVLMVVRHMYGGNVKSEKHEWRTRVNRRVNGSGCPMCARNARKAKILQLDSERKIFAEYTSLSEASEKVGISKSSISQACKTGKITGGFLWQKID